MGQIVSALVCLYCRSGCKSSVVASALTFHPPDPNYSFEEEDKGAKAGRDGKGKEGGGGGGGKSGDSEGKDKAGLNTSIAGIEYRPCSTTFLGDLQYLSDAVKAQHQAFFLTTSNGTQVPVMVWGAKPKSKAKAAGANPRASPTSSSSSSSTTNSSTSTTTSQFTIIVSHGNAADLGSMYVFYSMLHSNLGVNVVGYDYTGYGASIAKGIAPTEQQT
jgi:hypothetical protein